LDREEMARLLALIAKRAYFAGQFTLSSGKTSDYYLDARRVTLDPEGAWLVGRAMFERLRQIEPDAVGGPTLGADPIATAVAIASHLAGAPIPAFIVRNQQKAHGRQRAVEGPFPPPKREGEDVGIRVAIVEDVITTGGSIEKAIAAVEAEGCGVVMVLVAVDRQEGGLERLRAQGYAADALFTIAEVRAAAERVSSE